MMATRVLRSTFRIGIAKSFAFELVATRPKPKPSSTETTSLALSNAQSIVLPPSSFTSAETLNATLDKHLQEGQTAEMWVPASALCSPSDMSSDSSPLLLESNTNATTNEMSLVQSSLHVQPAQLLADWQSQGIESVAAKDLAPHADPNTHLPEELVQKMSPHHQQNNTRNSNNNTNKPTKSIASQLLVAGATNADKDQLIQALLTADPNDECAAHGASPLHLLASTHADETVAIECIHLLLDAGANLNKRANNGSSPLHWAAGNGNLDIAEALLACGADPSIMTFTWFRDVFGKHSGQTALHWAAESGHIEIVNMICDRAPEIVGSTDERGSTPSALALREAKFAVHSMLSEREEETYVLLRAKLEGIVAVPIK